jgi:hypothetical protein
MAKRAAFKYDDGLLSQIESYGATGITKSDAEKILKLPQAAISKRKPAKEAYERGLAKYRAGLVAEAKRRATDKKHPSDGLLKHLLERSGALIERDEAKLKAPKTIEEAKAFVGTVMELEAKGKLRGGKAAALLRGAEVFMRICEVHDLEKRIERLEKER